MQMIENPPRGRGGFSFVGTSNTAKEQETMRLRALREAVCRANLDLVRHGLVTCTWGNVSGIDRPDGIVAIKPSGVPYAELCPETIVLVDLESGTAVEGDLRPSSDTPTHLVLYRAFAQVGGVAHTHSRHATMFAQAAMPVRCLGTTHADHFNGDVPVTRAMTTAEIQTEYEANTGHVIVETFACESPGEIPGVLVRSHGPFTWGADAETAATNSIILETVAEVSNTPIE